MAETALPLLARYAAVGMSMEAVLGVLCAQGEVFCDDTPLVQVSFRTPRILPTGAPLSMREALVRDHAVAVSPLARVKWHAQQFVRCGTGQVLTASVATGVALLVVVAALIIVLAVTSKPLRRK